MAPFAIIGTLVDTLPDWTLRLRNDHILIVDNEGTIVHIGEALPQNLIDLREK